MVPQLSVIVPTYREAENLPILVPRIHQAAAAAGIDLEVIVVDDNSRDGTDDVCDRLRQTHPVRLIVRTDERGLSSAVITGIRAARGKIVVVMDADLSHPPEKIPELVAPLRDPDVDFVIGSRYASGASTADDWGAFRRLNSNVATWLARPFTSVKDPMAGFFAVRRSLVDAAIEILDPIGYKIGLELIVKCDCRNIVEVPIVFADRLKGESKLTFREQINYLRHLKRLFDYRFERLACFLQFVCVGLSGLAVDLSTFFLLLNWLPMPVSSGLAIWTAMTWNFILNRKLTFSYARRDSAFRQYLGFCASCLMGAVVNWSARVGLGYVHPFFAENRLAAVIVGVAGGTVFNYLLCRHVVFRSQTAKAPQSEQAHFPEDEESAPESENRSKAA